MISKYFLTACMLLSTISFLSNDRELWKSFGKPTKFSDKANFPISSVGKYPLINFIPKDVREKLRTALQEKEEAMSIVNQYEDQEIKLNHTIEALNIGLPWVKAHWLPLLFCMRLKKLEVDKIEPVLIANNLFGNENKKNEELHRKYTDYINNLNTSSNKSKFLVQKVLDWYAKFLAYKKLVSVSNGDYSHASWNHYFWSLAGRAGWKIELLFKK